MRRRLDLSLTSPSSKQREVRQAENVHLRMLRKPFGLPACSAYSLHPHVLCSQRICLPELNPRSAKWTFPAHMCLLVCVLLAAVPIRSPAATLNCLPHAMWEEVLPSFIDCADWVEKPRCVYTH